MALVTSTGATVAHEMPSAVETPVPDGSFFALIGLLGIDVGVIRRRGCALGGVSAWLQDRRAGARAAGASGGTPALRDGAGRLLHPAAVGGLLDGMAIMFATGLLVSV